MNVVHERRHVELRTTSRVGTLTGTGVLARDRLQQQSHHLLADALQRLMDGRQGRL